MVCTPFAVCSLFMWLQEEGRQHGAFMRGFSPVPTSVLIPILHGATSSALLTPPSPPTMLQALPITPTQSWGAQQLVPVMKTWSRQTHWEFPRGVSTLQLEVVYLSKLAGDEELLLQLPEATSCTPTGSPSRSEKRPKRYKGKPRGEKHERSGQQSSFLCELFALESSLTAWYH